MLARSRRERAALPRPLRSGALLPQGAALSEVESYPPHTTALERTPTAGSSTAAGAWQWDPLKLGYSVFTLYACPSERWRRVPLVASAGPCRVDTVPELPTLDRSALLAAAAGLLSDPSAPGHATGSGAYLLASMLNHSCEPNLDVSC